MTYEMLNLNTSSTGARGQNDPYDGVGYPFKSMVGPTAPTTSLYASSTGVGRGPHPLTLAEQAELEFELRYRGNMIVDQQRKIQQLEEELKRTRDQMESMANQLNSYEQERLKEKKKPQSRYWTPEEHQRFLEALAKYGHKDVKAISMHVSTRNATQVRTHAQKYFLRLERERRRKSEEQPRDKDGYGSSMDEGSSASPSPEQPSSPLDDMQSSANVSPANSNVAGIISTTNVTNSFNSTSTMVANTGSSILSHPASIPVTGTSSASTALTSSNNPVPARRRRPSTLISGIQARNAQQHRDAVLVALPATWTADDYEQFTRALSALADRTDLPDQAACCRLIREQYLPHHPLDEVEAAYRQLLKLVRQKSSVSSPKRRRSSKDPLIASGSPLPAVSPPNPNTYSFHVGQGTGNLSTFNAASAAQGTLSLHQYHPMGTASLLSSHSHTQGPHSQSSMLLAMPQPHSHQAGSLGRLGVMNPGQGVSGNVNVSGPVSVSVPPGSGSGAGSTTSGQAPRALALAPMSEYVELPVLGTQGTDLPSMSIMGMGMNMFTNNSWGSLAFSFDQMQMGVAPLSQTGPGPIITHN